MRLPFPERAVFEMVEAAANNGKPCPTNAEIILATGHASTSSAANAMAKLEAMGLIRVERFQVARVVTVIATGRATANYSGKPHTRRGSGSPRDTRYQYHRKRRLAEMIEAGERKLIGLHREARRYGMESLIADRPVKVEI